MSDIKEEIGGLKESIEFNEIWWNDVQEGEQICQDEIDLVLEMIVMAKAELEKNAALITTIESQTEQFNKIKLHAEHLQALVTGQDQSHTEYVNETETLIEQKDALIESQKEEIERLKSAIEQATRELPYGNSAYKILLKSLYPESFKAQGGNK